MISFDPLFGGLIARKAGSHFNPECDVCIARVHIHKDGTEELMGGSVFQAFTGASIGMHVASWWPRWINRDLLFTTFSYPFLQLGCERVFGQVPADNPDALRFDLNLGFKVIATIPGVFAGNVDCFVVCMEKHECRFLQKRGNSLSIAA